ncbi:MAG: peptidoglycan-binding protein [Rhodococcus sp.]|nr:peptidoglycan-binding protein [Rhodococcus sp. (in: high G+C Gram-positive bacteria)]
MLTKFKRDLHVVMPPMRGTDVSMLQKKLGKLHKIDGVYGPIVGNAVKDWKWRIGLPSHQVNTTLHMGESEYLFGKKRTLLMVLRSKSRLRKQKASVNKGKIAREEMSRWARQGFRETRTNYVPQLEPIAAKCGFSEFYQRMGWPWCAYATLLSGYIAGLNSAKLGRAGKYNALYVPEIVAMARAGKFGLSVVDWANARDGDLVVFNFDGGVDDHIGRLDGDPDPGAQFVETVEGNTSSGNTGSQNNGDGVYARIRHKSLITALIRES